jgi:DNA-binding transcriptional MerR regulator
VDGFGATRGDAAATTMSIGEVLAQLRPEFPEITISKLRFLEAEGLVEPFRAPSGYRKYSQDHVERLRYVLAAQRDRYLPLRVIREQIEATARGERVVGLPPAPPIASVPPVLSVAPVVSAPPVASVPPSPPAAAEPALRPTAPAPRADWNDARLTRAHLSERSGLDEGGLVDLEQYGLLPAPVNGFYGGEALAVARIAARLAEYGLEARHLRPYRTMADREVGLLAQLVPTLSHLGGRDGRQQALETVHELAALCAQLHGALVRHELRQSFGA